MPFLPAETLDFGNGHALDTDLIQGILDIIQPKRLDNCFDFFHAAPFKNYDR
jgi:hypothetical protein